MAFKCQHCGEDHEGLPMDIGFARPAAFLAVPPGQRRKRCRFTDDVGIIDGQRYYLRGVLPVPVRDAEREFVWGLWARVNRVDFERVQVLWNVDGSKEPPFTGHLSVEDRTGYEGLDGREVLIQLRSASERPAFRLAAGDEHRLAREQREGMTLHRVVEMLGELLPGQLG